MEEQLLSPYGEEAEATAARPTPKSRNKGMNPSHPRAPHSQTRLFPT